MSSFLMKPKIDFAFKEIMIDEKARTGFLASVLHLNPADIRETSILNSSLRKVHEDDKLGILDVRIRMNDDTEIDTEIQLSELKVWADRALFYVSKMYTEQIEQGQKYDVLKKRVSISILDFVLFKDEAEFYSRFHITEDTRHFIYTVTIHSPSTPHAQNQPAKLSVAATQLFILLMWVEFLISVT